jgi:hypothetical protein
MDILACKSHLAIHFGLQLSNGQISAKYVLPTHLTIDYEYQTTPRGAHLSEEIY